jgi:sarcosine oxidase subunit alpha
MDDPSQTPGDGAVVCEGENIVGYICSSRFSRTLGQSIGMALVTQDLAKQGRRINIYKNDSNKPLRFTATVVPTPFYDAEGNRLRS